MLRKTTDTDAHYDNEDDIDDDDDDDDDHLVIFHTSRM